MEWRAAQTVAAADSASWFVLIQRLTFAQIDYCVNRVLQQPSQLKFLRGWINRAFHQGGRCDRGVTVRIACSGFLPLSI